jgi:dTDP-4-dehydrorhamnose reductase
MTTILLLGKNGQVGRELETQLAGAATIVALGHAELDLADAEAVRAALRQIRPQLVVNAAAYTNVDGAESHPDAAMAVNCTAPAIIAQELQTRGGALIHYSTDYVFDGASARAYTEEDIAKPLNVYGATKLAGEQAIAASGVAHLILRTSWVYSHHGVNFVNTMRELARTRRELSVVNDQTGSPTWARTVARITRAILDHCENDITDYQGLYHLAAAGETTRFGLVEKMISLMAKNSAPSQFVPPVLHGVDLSRFPAPAARPRYSALAVTKLESRFGVVLPHWEDDLELFFRP